LSTEGRPTSASTSITVVSSSAAMLSARFTAVKVLPSPGSALVTMMRLPCATGVAPLPSALAISGRLMMRYWSAMRLRGAPGVTKLPAASRCRSSSTRREVAGMEREADARPATCAECDGDSNP
jgi:hypothetical protein